MVALGERRIATLMKQQTGRFHFFHLFVLLALPVTNGGAQTGTFSVNNGKYREALTVFARMPLHVTDSSHGRTLVSLYERR
jgi:hypothetical protein